MNGRFLEITMLLLKPGVKGMIGKGGGRA